MITDKERIDWLEEQNHCGISLLNDDNGHWAISGDGFQNVPMTEDAQDIETTFFIKKIQWKNSVREVIDFEIEKEKGDSEDTE